MTSETPDPVSGLALPSQWQQLVDASRRARQQAYAPYSRYQVGAAVLTESGQIFSGCNVENASYGLTICAERVAISSAIASGHRNFPAICVSLTGVPVPCGTCRQFLYEFNPNMLILLDNLDHPDTPEPECIRLTELLPRAFRLEQPQ